MKHRENLMKIHFVTFENPGLQITYINDIELF